MKDWNVVVTVFDQEGYRTAPSILSKFGIVGHTDFFNVLVVKVDDVEIFTQAIAELVERSPGIMNQISRIVPSHANFNFNDPSEFEEQVRKTVLGWANELGGCSFFVRLHRRGFKGRIKSPEEERFLDDALLAQLEKQGTPGRIDFENPDKVIDIETLGNRAGISRWSREELRKYPFLGID